MENEQVDTVDKKNGDNGRKRDLKVVEICPSCGRAIVEGEKYPLFPPYPLVACPGCRVCFVPQYMMDNILKNLRGESRIIKPELAGAAGKWRPPR